MSIIFLFLFIFSIQKPIKENVLLNERELLQLNYNYDYHIYLYRSNFPKSPIYFIIETELNTLPFDINYSLRNSNDTSKKNVYIYHNEQKGNLYAFFFKLEIPYDNHIIIAFNIRKIK